VNEGAGAYIFKRRTDEGAKIICNLFGSSIADMSCCPLNAKQRGEVAALKDSGIAEMYSKNEAAILRGREA
jgi:hypothetical protein